MTRTCKKTASRGGQTSKNDKKGACNERSEHGNGGGGSLKTEENKTSEYKKSRHWIKHALRA